MNPLTQGNSRSYEPVYSANVSGGERRGAFLPLLIALTITIGSRFNPKGKKTFLEQLPKVVKTQNLIAWGAVFIILTVATDYDTTYELALALSWLILLAVVVNNGMQFATNLNALVDNTKEA